MIPLVLESALTTLVVATSQTGSRAICNPAPTNTDEDHVVFTTHAGAFRDAACAAGWVPTLESAAGTLFDSYRKGELNLIVTENPAFYKRFVAVVLLRIRPVAGSR